MIFRSTLGQDPHVSEYQVQQKPRGARVLAITHGAIATDELQQILTRSLAEAGLPAAEVTVETVSDLPRHPETNKLKRFVPLD